jgi:hypothetical protein
VSPAYAELILAPISSLICGIYSSSIAWAINSIANPHLNNHLGAIITFLYKTSGLTH